MSSLLSPAPALLVNDRGGPVAPPDILRELHHLDPALGLRWLANFNESCWRVTWEWPASDRRWSRVQSGEIPRDAAYDIIGHLPVGCGLMEAKSFIEAHLKDSPTEEINRLRAKVAHWNAHEVPAQQTAQMVTDTLDDVAREHRAPKGQVVVAPKGRVRRKKP